MAIRRPFNRKATAAVETGLSPNPNRAGGRFFEKNGTPNIEVRGIGFFQRLNFYHALLSMQWWKFLASIILFFLGMNLLFMCFYLLIGVNHLEGMVVHNTSEKIGEAFFFSAQTFTTVGYGRINPVGFLASAVAAFEALTGILTFALVAGLLYGRFARPRAYIRFSKHAVFAPFKEGTALMFRMAPHTQNYLVNVEVRATMAMQVLEDGQVKNRFFNMPLDISKASTLTLNWTLVHVIDEDSPLYNLSKEDIANAKSEMLVFVQGFDETFSNTVISRSSYTYEEFVYGARFTPMYESNETGDSTILHMNKLDDIEPAAISIVF